MAVAAAGWLIGGERPAGQTGGGGGVIILAAPQGVRVITDIREPDTANSFVRMPNLSKRSIFGIVRWEFF